MHAGMCRFIAYLGEPITLESLVVRPRNSLINQSIDAQEFEERLNGDGFGLAWYARAVCPEPALFRSVTPAWSNLNLLRLARVVQSDAILAHVRAASPGMVVTEANCHPFASGRYAFMHNGHVGDFMRLRRPLRRALGDAVYDGIEGSTDSEHLFAMFLERVAAQVGADPTEAMARALEQTIRDVLALHRQHGTGDPSYLNLAVTDGESLVAARFTDGPAEDALSLYLHRGRRYVCRGDVCQMQDASGNGASVMVCSERLSDEPGWQPVPVNHLVLARPDRSVALRPIGWREERARRVG
jgi:ergothioneine biosynthesis protein EgtC